MAPQIVPIFISCIGLSISRYGFLTVIKLFTLVIKRGINTINSGIYHFAFLIKNTFYTTSIPLLYHCIYPPCPPIRTVDTGGHGWTQVDTGGHSTNDRMHQATSCEARLLLVGDFLLARVTSPESNQASPLQQALNVDRG